LALAGIGIILLDFHLLVITIPDRDISIHIDKEIRYLKHIVFRIKEE
jgi:hypothetical protein